MARAWKKCIDQRDLNADHSKNSSNLNENNFHVLKNKKEVNDAILNHTGDKKALKISNQQYSQLFLLQNDKDKLNSSVQQMTSSVALTPSSAGTEFVFKILNL